MSQKKARKAFKSNRCPGKLFATFVPFVSVSTLEIRNKKLVVAMSKSHSRNEAQIGFNSATHVQLTGKIQVIFGCISLHGFISLRFAERFEKVGGRSVRPSFSSASARGGVAERG